MRKFDLEQLNERMKTVQNPQDSKTMDTFLFTNRRPFCLKKITKIVQKRAVNKLK